MASTCHCKLLEGAQNGNLDTVKLWWEEHPEADVNTITNGGNETALHWACVHGHLDIVTYLTEECKANSNILNKRLLAPLHNACIYGWLDIVVHLVEFCEAHVNTQTKKGRTPLHYACRYARLEIVKYLTESCDADIHIEDYAGLKPRHLVGGFRCGEVTDYIFQRLLNDMPLNKSLFDTAGMFSGTTPNNVNIDRMQALEDDTLADVTFVVGYGTIQEKIKANSSILVATVPSLKTMLHAGIKHETRTRASLGVSSIDDTISSFHGSDSEADADENKDDESGDDSGVLIHMDTTLPAANAAKTTILLSNFHPIDVKYVLRYIYSGDFSFVTAPDMKDRKHLKSLLVAANHFDCWRLRVIIEAEMIEQHLSKATVVELILFGDANGCEALKDACFRFASEDPRKLLAEPGFHDLAKNSKLLQEFLTYYNRDGPNGGIDDKASKMSTMEIYDWLDKDGTWLKQHHDRTKLLAKVRKDMKKPKKRAAEW